MPGCFAMSFPKNFSAQSNPVYLTIKDLNMNMAAETSDWLYEPFLVL